MKKAFALAVGFCVLLCAGFAPAADKPVTVGISQIVEHPALDAARKGFIDELAATGYVEGKNIEFDYKNAQNNRPVSGQIARKFVGDKVDLILAISTPSAQDAAAAAKEIPILFAAVTDPVSAGLVKSLDAPGGNVSGTMDKSPVAAQLDLILEILPNVKRLGTVYNPGETNSAVSVNELQQEADTRGIELIKASATSSSAVRPAGESLVGKVDAIHVPTDNTVVLALESVVKVAQDNKIPLFAADVDSVARGAIAALAVDYYKLGRQTGAMAAKVLEKKARISELPVEYQKELQLHINPGQAEKMGVTLPDSVLKRAAKVIR
ncbi:MAG: ABC transporter substrate-binding protein [Desulfomonilaceae bacterium]|nr:ABC transporter substrate-binding protein [Desulfomonilaceae bacterium]